MTDTASPTTETKPKRHIAVAIVRVLLGLMCLFFGADGIFHFIPQPKEMPPEIMEVAGGLMKGGYMAVVAGTEIIVGVLLLINRFVPLALALFTPIVVGIITFHVAIAPASIGPGIVLLLLLLFLAWSYRGAFCPMLRAKTIPGA